MTPDQYCQQKAAASGSSFYYSFLFLPPERPKQERRRRPGSTEVRLEDFDIATVFDLFDTKQPFEMEIGSGKGRFLLRRDLERFREALQ